MKKQKSLRKQILTNLIILTTMVATIAISLYIVINMAQRKLARDKQAEEIWEIYYKEAFGKKEGLTSFSAYVESYAYCSCHCPSDVEDQSTEVRYHDATKDTIVTGILFKANPYKGLFERQMKWPNKYLLVFTDNGDTYADEFSPVPLYVDLRSQTVVLQGKNKNTLHIQLKSIEALNNIVNHIENYIPSDIPIL